MLSKVAPRSQGNGSLYTAYLARFSVKEQAAESNSPSGLWYSFNTAGIHVVMFGAYGLTITGADYAPGSPQYNWLVVRIARWHLPLSVGFRDAENGAVASLATPLLQPM